MTLSLFSSIEETFYVKPWFVPGGFVTVEIGNPKSVYEEGSASNRAALKSRSGGCQGPVAPSDENPHVV